MAKAERLLAASDSASGGLATAAKGQGPSRPKLLEGKKKKERKTPLFLPSMCSRRRMGVLALPVMREGSRGLCKPPALPFPKEAAQGAAHHVGTKLAGTVSPA